MTVKGNFSEIAVDPQRGFGPTAAGTFVLMTGLLLAYALIAPAMPSEMAMLTAWIVVSTLIASLLIEAKLVGLRQMIRVDCVALVAFYLLTLAEFLIPQPVLDLQLTPEEAQTGLTVIILGFAAIGTGRILVPQKRRPSRANDIPQMSMREILALSIICFSIGHLHMFLAVEFNPVRLWNELTDPRFTQDWSRGAIGGWNTLLYELHLLTYLIPPAGAMLLVNRKQISPIWIPVVCAMLVFEFFSGYSQGTRHVFAIHLITFCSAAMLSMRRLSSGRVAVFVSAAGAILILASLTAIEFRKIGLREYVNRLFVSETPGPAQQELTTSSNLDFMVDNNLRAIGSITSYFPTRHDYLGGEVMIHAVIHPIPRAIWKGKPEKLTVAPEEILGIQGATIAATFAGEGYMSYGYAGVIIFGVALGILCGFWNMLALNLGHRTFLMIYVAGFFWVTIAMRSVMWITVGALPCFALFFYARFVLPILRGPGVQAPRDQ